MAWVAGRRLMSATSCTSLSCATNAATPTYAFSELLLKLIVSLLVFLQAAEMRATSEHTLRSQAELAASATASRVAVLEAEAASLRTANQELFRAKSFAEEQRDSAAGWVWGWGGWSRVDGVGCSVC